MAYLSLHGNCIRDEVSKNIVIMVFTEGTILGPRNIFLQFNHASYVPIKSCIHILKAWEKQGAGIFYITSRKKIKQVNTIKNILLNYGFPGHSLYYREKGQKYKDLVEEVHPDVLVEDDCKSIGGKWQMSITYVKHELKETIKSIVVKEFKGINHLPEQLSELIKFSSEVRYWLR